MQLIAYNATALITNIKSTYHIDDKNSITCLESGPVLILILMSIFLSCYQWCEGAFGGAESTLR